MQFDWWTFSLQLINLGVLMALLARFLFRPVADIIAKRQADIRATIDAAEAEKRKAAEAEAEARAERARIAAERQSVLDDARAEVADLRRHLLDHARAEAAEAAEAIRAEARRAAEEDRHARERRAVDLAVVIARRLVEQLPDAALVAGYADRLAGALQDMPPEKRAAFREDLPSLVLRAPRKLTEAELEGAANALKLVFKSQPLLKVEVEPDLIAGLELSGPHSVIHNSMAHDLGRISEALVRDAHI